MNSESDPIMLFQDAYELLREGHSILGPVTVNRPFGGDELPPRVESVHRDQPNAKAKLRRLLQAATGEEFAHVDPQGRKLVRDVVSGADRPFRPIEIQGRRPSQRTEPPKFAKPTEPKAPPETPPPRDREERKKEWRANRAAQVATEQRVEELKKREADLARQIADGHAERERIGKAAASAALKNEPAPDNGAALRKIQRLDLERPGLEAAQKAIRAERIEAERAAAAPSAVGDYALADILRADFEAAAEELKAAADLLAPHLAALIAVDITRETLAPRGLLIDPTKHVVRSGRVIAKTFIDSFAKLPGALRPDNFDLAQIEAAAAAIAANTLTEINGEQE